MLLDKLKEPIPYKWRVQSAKNGKAVCVAYVDSRQVQDVLDAVLGIENWQSDYKEVKGNVYAGIGVFINGTWVWKWDCGVESKEDAEKGEASDSFKRAAVKWGVGRFLYSLEIKTLEAGEYNGKWYPLNKKTGKLIFNGSDLNKYIKELYGGEKGKPKISPIQFDKLIQRVKNGDIEAGEKSLNAFTFSDEQRQELITEMAENF